MRKKVLLVEDNAALLELLRLSYKAAGYSVATATNGIDALKKARSVVPDVVVLDLVLPELDGFAVCETLRKAPLTSNIPILLVTGLSSQLARFAALESGGTDFLTKPVGPDALLERTRDLLAKRIAEPRKKAAPVAGGRRSKPLLN